jgi:hypothetical protein
VRIGTHLALVLAVLIVAVTAQAQTKEQCAEAYEEAQSLRLERKLIEAHARLVTCTSASCPSAITVDCWRWLSEAEEATPSIVVGARAEGGGDLVTASILLDGQAVDAATSGTAISLNPGQHTLHAEAEGYGPVDQTIVVREGEKSRVVTLTLRSLNPEPAAAAGVTAPGTSAIAVDTNTSSGKVGWPVYALAGVAVAAFAVTAAVGIKGYNDGKHMRDTCKGHCDQDKVDAARHKIIAANVTFGVGVAALAGGVLAYVLSRRQKEPTQDTASVGQRWQVRLDLTSSSGVAQLHTSF